MAPLPALPAWFAATLDAAQVPGGAGRELVAGFLTGDVDPRLDGELAAALRDAGLDERGLRAVGEGLEQAAESAKDLEDHAGAARLFDLAAQAYGAAGDRLGRASALYVRGGQLRHLDHHAEAVAAFEAAAALFAELDDDEHRSDAAYQIGATWHLAGDDETAERELLDAAVWYVAHDDRTNHAYCAALLGEIASARGDHDVAVRHLEGAVAGFDAAGPADQRGLARFTLAAALWRARRHDEAAAVLREARPILDEATRIWHVAACDFLSGEVAFAVGDYATARSAWEAALELFEIVGDEDDVAACRASLGSLP